MRLIKIDAARFIVLPKFVESSITRSLILRVVCRRSGKLTCRVMGGIILSEGMKIGA
jgi:hypothetical protein